MLLVNQTRPATAGETKGAITMKLTLTYEINKGTAINPKTKTREPILLVSKEYDYNGKSTFGFCMSAGSVFISPVFDD